MTITTGALKILFVLTSHSQMGDTGHKTGFWVEEFANPYYTLVDQGVDITIATPKGGVAPIDPTSDLPQNATEDTKRFNEDAAVQKKINKTIALADINFEDYDAVFYPGGHGPLWDLAEDATSAKLIQDFDAAKKPIAFVCHAPAALRHVKNAQGEFLVKGKKVTGFTNEEEEAVQLTKVVPFLVEDMLKENGGIYSKGDNWVAYAVQDGNLITGQNPASSALVAEMLLKMLEKK
ncbi:type 1 glutamine amidotransferase domain-containing protein [Labilibaculum euxinus]|uniref:Type 1 glutamine amidotransferase domain-containing protein n=1 Tax=Labilibaculum euxinus TaxID=2686357 RepID=A0A7M4D550_9BACT|nr:type 1 glutamine amidotransferase domain-containing protein [Labilibaculum euxinus]MUP37779.1 type 1 glutamine amidotransferase domain-containing protein [Labilibaculum euxinus]MVB06984.1 type 1 glutamine amidotransferase domain-containing protein [Labilibaculum euxinus]